jgi:hypothetical protein
MAGSDRSRADGALLEALLAGRTTGQAAADAHVSERTVRRRLNDPGFQRQLAEARAARYERVLDRTSEYVAAALTQLGRFLIDDANNPHLGMPPGQFYRLRLEAVRLLTGLYFGGRAAARDTEVLELRQLLEGLEREVATFRELYGLQDQEGGVDAGHGWPQASR